MTPSHPMYNLGGTPPVPQKPQSRPLSLDELQGLVSAGLHSIAQTAIDAHKMPLKIIGDKVVDSLEGTDLSLSKFVTVHPPCLAMKEEVVKLAKCPDPVLIMGETGTGKEIIARSMIGDRRGSFIAINCAGLPENLIESELFGHAAGSFTGATGTKQGLCQAAKEGILFLDEIGELPLAVQAKLLRAIQDMKVRRVGSNMEEDISCKFVCATHRNLEKMVEAGTFREDLFARLSIFELTIPSLRDRSCDIEPILLSLKGGSEFLKAMREKQIRISDIPLRYNVRSLQKLVRRHAVLGTIILTKV